MTAITDDKEHEAHLQQWIKGRAAEMLADPDEVQDLLETYAVRHDYDWSFDEGTEADRRFRAGNYWMARLLVDAIARDPTTWSQAERHVYDWLLDEATTEIRARMEDV
jgi:hypothetical protein